ncbi:MAG TPA: LuxR C-terminal-related transcriptional regulator [Marmoricola sp.]|jgi:DNA-binding CsgD family transcriptional regulator
MGVVEDLVRAREAFDRREWVAAYEGLADPAQGDLRLDDVVRLATVAYLLGRPNDCVQAMQRGYHLALSAGDVPGAVRCAFWLAMVLLDRGETAVGGGWVARAQRHLQDIAEDVVERGYVLVHVMFRHIFSGDLLAARGLAEEITGYGRRFLDPDLLGMGLCAQGRIMCYLGQVRAGLTLLDEAMVGVAAGESTPIFSGHIYCSMIEACQEVGDFDRAARWTEALTTWCDAQPGLVSFTGQCAVHRGQIMRERGAFDEALVEFDLAVERYLQEQTPGPAGVALTERGDVLRLRGDLAGAEAAYERAIALGCEPQPGLALLWLARGRTSAAVAAIRRLLGEAADPVHRSQLLPAAVEILCAADLDDEAAPLAVELAEDAASFGCLSMTARAHQAAALLAVRDGRPEDALAHLRPARASWERLGARYDVARCRLLVGRALSALGDDESARAEDAFALRTFRELGAVPAAGAVPGLPQPSIPGGLTAREVEVLRLVATGRTNPEIAAALVLSEKTVARHLSNIFTKIEVSSRTAAAAFAFEHGLA